MPLPLTQAFVGGRGKPLPYKFYFGATVKLSISPSTDKSALRCSALLVSLSKNPV